MKLHYRYRKIDMTYEGKLLYYISAGEIPRGELRELLISEGYPAYNKPLKLDRVVLLLENGHIFIAPLNPKYTTVLNY